MTWDGTAIAIDSDGDNYLDQSGIDSSGDGRLDIWQMDEDADGLVDMMAFDMDGDGLDDQWTYQPESTIVGDWSASWTLPGQSDPGTVVVGGPVDPASFVPINPVVTDANTIDVGGPVDPASFVPLNPVVTDANTINVGGPVDPASFVPIDSSALYPSSMTIGGYDPGWSTNFPAEAFGTTYVGGPYAPGSFGDTMSTLFGIAYNTPYPLDDILVLDSIWSQQAMNDIWL